VDSPEQTLAEVCEFLGVSPGPDAAPRPENVKAFVPAEPRADRLRRAVRVGAAAGSLLPPQVWRRVSAPLIRRLHAGGAVRPPLPTQVRRSAVDLFADDIHRLGDLLGRSFEDWAQDSGRGAFADRRESDD
jgi:hypothetical protein